MTLGCSHGSNKLPFVYEKIHFHYNSTPLTVYTYIALGLDINRISGRFG